ncbi:MAG: hypothetical protein J6J75_00600, partial [Alistipes sp.]|nr:hypothetical protein [Alistipes sp.]
MIYYAKITQKGGTAKFSGILWTQGGGQGWRRKGWLRREISRGGLSAPTITNDPNVIKDFKVLKVAQPPLMRLLQKARADKPPAH